MPSDETRRLLKLFGVAVPNLEKIRALDPDLVIANIEENRREDIDRLRAWSIPVWVAYPRTVAEGIAFIGELGALTGAEVAARALLRELEPLHDRVRKACAGRPPVAVFYPIWRGPYMTI